MMGGCARPHPRDLSMPQPKNPFRPLLSGSSSAPFGSNLSTGAGPVLARLLCWAALGAFASCGGDAPDDSGGAPGAAAENGDTMPVLEVLAALVGDASLRTVIQEHPESKIRAEAIEPQGRSNSIDGGVLPALLMSPPAEVSFNIPGGEPGAVLRFAAGIGASSYGIPSTGPVRFEVEWRGTRVFDRTLRTGSEVGREDKRWHRDELDVSEGGRLVLRTSRVEDVPEGAPPVQCGFGLLKVVRHDERPRTVATPEHPNVLLITVDTLRADGLSTYGNPRKTSPVIDALARQGVVFERAYSPAPWTWPSTASILTSLTPPEHGVLSPETCYLADELVTVAEAFQDQGVTTGAFSCNPLIARNKNFQQGFEVFREYPPTVEDWVATEEILGDVRAWLDEYSKHRFFLYLHLIDPHGPYIPDEDFAERWAGPKLESPFEGNIRPALDRHYAGEEMDYEGLVAWCNYKRSLYDAEVSTLDRSLGKLFADLRQRGLLENTLVCLTSDHGEEFLEHKMLAHGKQLHRESVHVPLIFFGPGIPAGERVREPVENRFAAPTLLNRAGLRIPARFGGRDLLDAAEVEAAAEDPVFFTTHLGKWIDWEEGRLENVLELHAVRMGDRGLMWAPQQGEEPERLAFFDLARDPEEQIDLAEERGEDVEELKLRIRGWLEASESVRPDMIHGGDSARELLQGIGYIEEDREFGGGGESPR